MKFTTEITVNVPRARFIELFDNPDNMKHWQPGLVSFEPVSGTPGQPGAKSRLRYAQGSREVEMIETITVRNLPDEFSGTYEGKGFLSVVKNYFSAPTPNTTRWVADNEFQMSGFMKLMAWLMPGVFKKESQKLMDQFKAFAEKTSTP